MAAVVMSAQALIAQTDAADISGHWCATTYYDVGLVTNRTEPALITIRMAGSQVFVRTSHQSTWKGTFDPNSRTLTAAYTRGRYKGHVELQLNQRSTVLEGQWFSTLGDSGRYVAVRYLGPPVPKEGSSKELCDGAMIS